MKAEGRVNEFNVNSSPAALLVRGIAHKKNQRDFRFAPAKSVLFRFEELGAAYGKM